MHKQFLPTPEVGDRASHGDAARDPDYLTYANICHLIDQHLEERSLMLDVHTRFLLSRLSETASAQAERKRAEIESAIATPRPMPED